VEDVKPVFFILKKRISTGNLFVEEARVFTQMNCEIGGFHPV
jgi:hypothetical protein